MLSQDFRVPRARAHAIKYKATYCLVTSWGSTTTAARSPTTHIPIPWRRGFTELCRRRKCKKKEKQSCGFDGQLITFQTSQARQDRSDWLLQGQSIIFKNFFNSFNQKIVRKTPKLCQLSEKRIWTEKIDIQQSKNESTNQNWYLWTKTKVQIEIGTYGKKRK